MLKGKVGVCVTIRTGSPVGSGVCSEVVDHPYNIQSARFVW